MKSSLFISAPQEECCPLEPEAAAAVAGVVAAIRGAGKPHTTPAECRSLNAAFFTDLCQVRKSCPKFMAKSGLIRILTPARPGRAEEIRVGRDVPVTHL